MRINRTFGDEVKPYKLQPWDHGLYEKAFNLFHTPGAKSDFTVATVEYMKALNDTMHSGEIAYNISLNLIDKMTPDVASFAIYNDFREFDTPIYNIIQMENEYAELIGISHWF